MATLAEMRGRVGAGLKPTRALQSFADELVGQLDLVERMLEQLVLVKQTEFHD